MQRAAAHLPEYAIEAACLAAFMVSAALVATALYHPVSPLAAWEADPLVKRVPMGLAMGSTAVALIYSRVGRRSGAHMNPAVTLAYLRLGKIAPADALGYIVAQFIGGTVGILGAVIVLGGLAAHPAVNYVATIPGSDGPGVAFAAETLISFLMMSTILTMSNHPTLTRYTGIGAGLLVATYITLEAPFSGMSMNPARTLGSNILAAVPATLWIYFTAPPLGMLLAAEWYVRRYGAAHVRCAKLHHTGPGRCIFRCGHMETPR
jgi:aquaporin Z